MVDPQELSEQAVVTTRSAIRFDQRSEHAHLRPGLPTWFFRRSEVSRVFTMQLKLPSLRSVQVNNSVSTAQ